MTTRLPRFFRSTTALGGVLLCLSLAACGSSKASAPGSNPPKTSSSSPVSSPASGECSYPASGGAAKQVETPPSAPAIKKAAVTLATSAGDLTANLDGARTPCTVNNFVSLAKQGYFDGSICHRLTTDGIFVLQCGDPSGSGAGGPGYSFPDELSGDETYGPGTLAMANSGPNTNGSQFFLVYGDSSLPPNYTVFGSIDEAGLKTVSDIAAKGTADGATDGAPKDEVSITSVTVK